MAFTDEDVKGLKEVLDVFPEKDGSIRIAPEMTVGQFRGLIARLEAAENMLPFFISDHKGCPNKDCLIFSQAKAWRTAAGK